MSISGKTPSAKIIYIIVLFNLCLEANSSPLFFFNPFAAAPKSADENTENVSIYTTTQSSQEDSATTAPPSVYHQIARNVLERIATPVVSHFILVNAMERSGKIVSTTSKPAIKGSQLEIVEDAIHETGESTNPTDKIDIQIEETEGRELPNPDLVPSNPSFNKSVIRGGSRPERLTLYPYTQAVKEDDKEASEVKDLNMITGEFFNTISDLPDDEENEVDTEQDREIIDPNVTKTTVSERSDANTTDEDDEEDDDDFATTTGRTGFKKNLSESGVIYILELIGSVYTIVTGLLQSLFPSNTKMPDTMP